MGNFWRREDTSENGEGGSSPPCIMHVKPPPLSSVLCDADLQVLLDLTGKAAPEWKGVGLQLGFLANELYEIESKPLLLPGGSTAYYCELLSRWLDWAPPNHPFPTVSALAAALRKIGKERTAYELEKKKGSAEPMAEGSTRTVAVMPLESILEFEDAPKNLSREVQTAAPTDGSLYISESVAATRDRIDQLEEKYDTLLVATQKYLQQKPVDIIEFRTKVTRLPRSMKGDHQYQQYIINNLSALSTANTIDEVFVLLNFYWDYLNYHLLERIVHLYGDDKIKEMMRQFVVDMQAFRETTTLEMFWKAHGSKHSTIPKDLTEAVFKHSNLIATSSLEEVEDYRRAYASQYALPEFVMILVQVQPGCVTTMWLIPTPIAITLRDRMQSGEVQFLQKNHILEMKLNGTTVYTKSDQPTYESVSSSTTQPVPLEQSLESECLSSPASPLPLSIPLENEAEQQEVNIITAFLGVPHIVEDFLSHLDVQSLLQAEQVCKHWRWVVSKLPVWKNHIQCKIKNSSLWRNLFKRRGWSKYLTSSHLRGRFYRDLYLSASRDIHHLQENWSRGNYTLSRTKTSSHVQCLQCNEERIVSGYLDGTIRLHDRKSLENISVLNSKDRTSTVRCIELTGEVVISGSQDGIVRLWDVQTGQVINKIVHHKDTVYSLKLFSNTLVTGSLDSTVAVWEYRSSTDVSLKKKFGHGGGVWSVDIDEIHIISGSGGGIDTIKVWDVFTFQLLYTLSGHTWVVRCLQLRGQYLVSGSWDKTVRVWNLETQKCLRTLQGHGGRIWSVGFTEDRICSGCDDGTIKLWDFQAAINTTIPDSAEFCLATLKEHTTYVHGLHCDDFQLVTGSTDKSILIWDFWTP